MAAPNVINTKCWDLNWGWAALAERTFVFSFSQQENNKILYEEERPGEKKNGRKNPRDPRNDVISKIR